MFQIYNFQTMIGKILKKSTTMDRPNAIPLIKMPFHSFRLLLAYREAVTIRFEFSRKIRQSPLIHQIFIWILTNTHKLSLVFVSKVKLLFTKKNKLVAAYNANRTLPLILRSLMIKAGPAKQNGKPIKFISIQKGLLEFVFQRIRNSHLNIVPEAH